MPPTHYNCQNCPLNGGRNHRVAKLQRVSHQADIQAHQDAQAPPNIDDLANLLTGLVVADDGADPRSQAHSKLFSSRDDFQATVPDVPTAFAPLSASQALRSVEAVQFQQLPLRPSAIQSREQNTALLNETLQRIRAAHADLDLQHALNASPDDIAALTQALDAATTTVMAAGRLLSSIKTPADKVDPPTSRASRTNARLRQSRDQDDATFKALVDNVKTEAGALDSLVDVVGRLVPKSVSTDELEYDTEHHFENSIGDYDTVAQVTILLAVICHVIVGISTNPCNFILELVTMIIRLTMSIGSTGDRPNPKQEDVLKQLLTSLESALSKFKIDPKTVIYATCPSCHNTHKPTKDRLTGDPSYPETCEGYVYPKDGVATLCGKQLLEMRQGKLRPVKPFVYTSFVDYVAAMVAEPGIETMCEESVDTALAAVREALSKNPDAPPSAESVNNVFEAAFLRSFKGPVPGKLFIERDGRLRLAFQVMLDFFNTNGTRKRGNHNSIGILAVVNLNLVEDIRYRPEFMWISILLGPDEPNSDEINHYFRPLVDDFVVGWERGIRLSRTALFPSG
ncbi:hypothetical protein C8F01DRAFT_1301002 [Mycena amicta]|nr:hypothetical protein C8F01DRAFT_1301002 [Mycena amicta]